MIFCLYISMQLLGAPTPQLLQQMDWEALTHRSLGAHVYDLTPAETKEISLIFKRKISDRWKSLQLRLIKLNPRDKRGLRKALVKTKSGKKVELILVTSPQSNRYKDLWIGKGYKLSSAIAFSIQAQLKKRNFSELIKSLKADDTSLFLSSAP